MQRRPPEPKSPFAIRALDSQDAGNFSVLSPASGRRAAVFVFRALLDIAEGRTVV